MARYFNARLALAQIEGNPIHPIRPTASAQNRANRANRAPPDLETFEERAAIIQFDGGEPRYVAEDLAARAQGFGTVIEFRSAIELGDQHD